MVGKITRIVHQLPHHIDLSSNPPTLPQLRRDIPVPQKSATCFSISNLLSPTECEQFIQETNKLGYETLEEEYPSDYRNSTRVMIRSPDLADSLYERIVEFFRRSDIDNAHPYGFSNAGIWKPIGLNDVFKFSCYPACSSFSPHYDGCFVVSNEVRSIFTLLIYLNDGYTGGETVFEKRRKELETVLMYGNQQKTKSVLPLAGMALIFNHDIMHSGAEITEGTKYVVKTEIIFRRTDWSSIPSQLKAYEKDPLYQKASKLYALSDKLEKNGDVTGATSVYLQAVAIQVKHKTYPKLPDSEENTPCFPVDIFSIIFEYVDIKTVLACTQVSWRWFKTVQDGLIWFHLFKRHFPALFQLEGHLHSNQTEEKAFLKDWYYSYKVCYLLHNSKYPPVCIDIGSYSFKLGISGKEMKEEATYVGIETHPHYLVVGGGLVDSWKAGDGVTYGGSVVPYVRPFTRGQVRDWYAMWVLVHQVYISISQILLGQESLHCSKFPSTSPIRERKITKCDPHLHPVLLAEGPVPFDREKLYHLMFTLLEVPALCIVDSALLALHALGRTTGVVIDCGKENIVCTPVWNGTILKENRKTYGIGGRLMAKYFNALLLTPVKYSRKYGVIKEVCRVVLDPLELNEKEEPPEVWRFIADIQDNAHLRAPELFFNSHLLLSLPPKRALDLPPEAVETTSIIDFVFNTVMECEETKRNELFNSLLLCGGLAEMKGFIPRFEKEMRKKRNEIKIISHPHPSFTVLEGAYSFSSSSSFPSLCVNRADFLATQEKLKPINIVETAVVGELIAKFSKI